jgi:hypothetical protein
LSRIAASPDNAFCLSAGGRLPDGADFTDSFRSHTAFTYKGKANDVKQIGRELNVRYVLEGSVQRGGNRMRVNVQLIDAETGNISWPTMVMIPGPSNTTWVTKISCTR